jgi:hypothetical protein
MTDTAEMPDFSQITDNLYISAFPEGRHLTGIQQRNIRLILSMHWRRPSRSLDHPQVQLLWLPTIDSPLTPMPMDSLRRGVEAALPVIAAGQAVLVHCKQGIHRSVAMACCVLVGLGYSADEAMHLVKEQRPVADPFAGYIQARIRKFEQVWKAEHPGPVPGA